MSDSLKVLIDRKYNGPPDSAHGGVACGLFAPAVNAKAATVRLMAPPPLGVEMTGEQTDSGFKFASPSGDVASVSQLSEDVSFGELPWLDETQLRSARQHWDETWKPTIPFTTCFACGYERPNGDGLELFAGEVPDSDLAGSIWKPSPGLGNESGEVFDWAVWAALDCPSGAVVFRYMTEDSIVLLGEFTVRINRTPQVGQSYQVVARRLEVDGRRLKTEVAVVAADGSNLASGLATWILVRTAS